MKLMEKRAFSLVTCLAVVLSLFFCPTAAAACSHASQYEAWSSQYDMTFRPVSDTEHEIKGYVYLACSNCGAILGEPYPKTVRQSHNLDGAGDCPECGYTRSCTHATTKLVMLNGYPAYRQHDEYEHIYIEQYKEVCANASCGKVVRDPVDAARVYEYQSHRFNSKGVCRDCDYVKPSVQEPLSIRVSRGQSSATVGDTLYATASVSGGTGDYDYAWRVSRDGGTIAETSWGMGDQYSYTANKPGSYAFTVTVEDSNGTGKTSSSGSIIVSEAMCRHNAYTESPLNSSYQRESDTRHKKITVMVRTCDSCGEELSRYNKETYEDHAFSGGRCICGLAEPTPCPHTNSKESLTGSVIESKGNTKQHVLLLTYTTVCMDCGVTVGTSPKRDMADHAFNASGVCACGYAKPTEECDHANKTSAMTGNAVYERIDDEMHRVTEFYRDVCADCGIVINEARQVIRAESHSVAGGKCICGQMGHIHNFQRIEAKRDYIKTGDDERHKVEVTYYEQCSCGERSGSKTEYLTALHTYPSKGRIEALHYEGLGHQYFDRCECGYARYTGKYGKLSGCSKCYPAVSEGESAEKETEVEPEKVSPAPDTIENELPQEREDAYKKLIHSVDNRSTSNYVASVKENSLYQISSKVYKVTEDTVGYACDFIADKINDPTEAILADEVMRYLQSKSENARIDYTYVEDAVSGLEKVINHVDRFNDVVSILDELSGIESNDEFETTKLFLTSGIYAAEKGKNLEIWVSLYADYSNNMRLLNELKSTAVTQEMKNVCDGLIKELDNSYYMSFIELGTDSSPIWEALVKEGIDVGIESGKTSLEQLVSKSGNKALQGTYGKISNVAGGVALGKKIGFFITELAGTSKIIDANSDLSEAWRAVRILQKETESALAAESDAIDDYVQIFYATANHFYDEAKDNPILYRQKSQQGMTWAEWLSGDRNALHTAYGELLNSLPEK